MLIFHRLREMSDLMSTMQKEQQELLNSLSAISSQEPVWGAGYDPEAAFEEYVAGRKNAAAGEGQ